MKWLSLAPFREKGNAVEERAQLHTSGKTRVAVSMGLPSEATAPLRCSGGTTQHGSFQTPCDIPWSHSIIYHLAFTPALKFKHPEYSFSA